jgi:hypothetical protein
MSDGGVIRTLSESELPPCPNGMLQPIHPAHRLRVEMIDAAYEAAKEYEDDDGELPEPLQKVSTALSYGPNTDSRMRLYFNRVGFPEGGVYATVESWYFQCHICGLILPAQRITT